MKVDIKITVYIYWKDDDVEHPIIEDVKYNTTWNLINKHKPEYYSDNMAQTGQHEITIMTNSDCGRGAILINDIQKFEQYSVAVNIYNSIFKELVRIMRNDRISEIIN